MKVTVFNGSPRAENSNTHVIASAFLKGAETAGAEVQNIFLSEKNIKHCIGCFTCWHKTPGKCIHRDDMDELLEIVLSSDIICLATPVYLWNMTAHLKNFMDRLIPTKRHNVVEEDGHYEMSNSEIPRPKIVILSNAGFPGDNNFETMKMVMRSMEPTLEVYRNCGMLMRTKDAAILPKVSEYLEYVSKAGAEMASVKSVSPETLNGLSMDIMSTGDYVAYISRG